MSNVKTAVGIEKQFSPQPRDLYQKNLQGLSGNIRVDVDASTKYQDLARSLGVLGDTLEADFISKEKNKKKIGIAEAERIISSQSEEDMMKLSAIELLNNHSEHSIADNPYAITTIEKMRGKYFGARAKTEYDVWRKDQPPVKEASEEVARYTKYVQDTYGEVSGVATDQEAFQKGFYDNFIPDQKEKADGFLKEKANEMDVIRKGSALAEATEIMENAKQFTPTEVAERLTNLFKEATLAGQSYKDKWELAGFITDSYAKLYGDVDGLQQIREETLIGSVDPKTGNPLRLSDFYPASDAYRMAEVRAFQINNEEMRTETERLKGLTIPELHAYKDELFETDIKEFNKMLPSVTALITQKEQEEKKQKAAQIQVSAERYVQQEAEAFLQAQFEAKTKNWTITSSGAPRYDSLSAMPPIPYKTIDSQGNIITKEFRMTKELADGIVWKGVQQIEQDSSLSPKEKFDRVFDLFGWEPASGAKEMYKNTITSALTTITPDQKMTPQLQRSLDLYQTSPEKFHELFGKDATAITSAILTLGNSRGNLEEGIMLYATTKDKRRDEKLMTQVKTEINRHISLDTTLEGFKGIDGNLLDIRMSLSANSTVRMQVEELATTLRLAGLDTKTAIKDSVESVKKVNYIYKETTVPKSIFNDLPVENKGYVGKLALDHIVANYCNETGMQEAFIRVEWDFERNQLVINNDPRYTVNDIQWEALERLKELEKGQAQSGSRNVTLEDIKRPEYSIPEHEDEWRND